MKMLLLLLVSMATIAKASPSSTPLAPVDGVHYSVKQGDTLYGLADAYLIHILDYNVLQQQIHLAIPQHLQPHTLVILPRYLLKSVPIDAKLIAFRGNVQVNQASPNLGMALREGMTISTATDAFATLTLSNGSKITVPSQSTIKLTRLRKIKIDNSLDYEISVEDGRVETKATHLDDPNSRFRFKTPLAISAVRGTEFRIAYAKDGHIDSLTEVLEGSVAVGTPASTAPALIPQHIGAGISMSGGLHKEVLLPAPTISDPETVQKDDTVHFTLTPVPGASRYHVQIAHDAGFVDIVSEQTSETPQLDFANIANGNFFVRASAISARGFEGLTSASTFLRRLNAIHGMVDSGVHGGYHFKWFASGAGEKRYRFQLLRKPSGTTPLIDETGLTASELELIYLDPGNYYWRVGVFHVDGGDGTIVWTDPEKLTISRVK